MHSFLTCTADSELKNPFFYVLFFVTTSTKFCMCVQTPDLRNIQKSSLPRDEVSITTSTSQIRLKRKPSIFLVLLFLISQISEQRKLDAKGTIWTYQQGYCYKQLVPINLVFFQVYLIIICISIFSITLRIMHCGIGRVTRNILRSHLQAILLLRCPYSYQKGLVIRWKHNAVAVCQI